MLMEQVVRGWYYIIVLCFMYAKASWRVGFNLTISSRLSLMWELERLSVDLG